MTRASVTLCVTYSVVAPNSSWTRRISVRILGLLMGSRLLSGSSIRNDVASVTIARARATRWRSPPDSSSGLRGKRYSLSPTRRATLFTRERICSSPQRRAFSGRLRLE